MDRGRCRAEDVGMHAIKTDHLSIDAEITRLAQRQGALDHEIGRWLLIAFRAGVHHRLGMGSFGEYVERRLGYTPKVTKEKLRTARVLERLPRLRTLLESGERTWSA